ncbi:hypothetical protein UFOVP724_27 [uncultured Caudovirales phage]|uniref:Uncharacterized protein n=1 Tax=uncultured Caudovirales phage TaxID=2100421 RepID=A0A6J5NM09_9CAUD|nr:hypothetical protein UFOVP724_27 [uncultured Caudovirales phage]
MSFTRNKKVEVKDVPVLSSKCLQIVYVKVSYSDDPSKVYRGFSVKREDGNYNMLTATNISKKIQFTDASLRKGICGVSLVLGSQEHAVPVGCNNLTVQMLEDADVTIVRPTKGAPWCDVNDSWYVLFCDDETLVEVDVDGNSHETKAKVVHELSSGKVYGDGIPLVTPYKCSDDPVAVVPDVPDADPVPVPAPDAIDDSFTDLFGEDEHMAIFEEEDDDVEFESAFDSAFHQNVVVPTRPLHDAYSFLPPPQTGMSEEEMEEALEKALRHACSNGDEW